jgi:anti-anti-sigma factor
MQEDKKEICFINRTTSKVRTMDTITKVNQLSFHKGLNSESAFTIRIAHSKFDGLAGSELFSKVESWVAANAMMNEQEIPALIVDMINVEFIDSQGLHKLLAALKLMQSQKSNLFLCSQQPSVSLVFEITRFDQLFAIFPSLDTLSDQSAFHHNSYKDAAYLVAA